MMRLTHLRLRNFCGFRDYTVQFGPCTVLIGPNNGGKTTILRAINLVFASLHRADQSWAQRQHLLDQMRAMLLQHKQQLEALNTTSGLNPHAALQRQQQIKTFEHNTQQLKKQLHPLRIPSDFVAKLFNVPSISSLDFAHDSQNRFRLELLVAVDEMKCEISAAAEGSNIVVDVRCDGESLLPSLDSRDESVLAKLRGSPAEFVPPTVTVLPAENSLSWPAIQEKINQGHASQVWRNRIHWLSEGKDPELYRRVVDRVRTSLSGVRLNVPGRTQDATPLVTLTYEESGNTFDLSESGSGFRTLFGLVANVELSPAEVLLLDEPDSHLHASIQRQVAEFLSSSAAVDKQVILTTHAPDMIEEFPLEDLVWVDRSQTAGSPAGDLQQALVDLGVADHRQAFQMQDAKAILYFEDKIDEKILSTLLERCGKSDLLRLCRPARLRGAGDSCHLGIVARFLSDHLKTPLPMVAILDADYVSAPDPVEDGFALTVYLPCKELENLLLVQPSAIARQVQKLAEQKGRVVDLSTVKLEEWIDQETATEAVTKQVRYNWTAARCADGRKIDAGSLSHLDQEFEALWCDANYRRRHCPGKTVLRSVKRRIQESFKLSLNDAVLFREYEPDAALQGLFDRVEQHVTAALAGSR